ncbi:ester cyclase [Tengunoibacter tsumagoiensis]|uniref:SnoaL-like domain-containing protein n=1 Tax=Tengunoibacter tsumagoiensis TaxID=2014871 RepID=A0A401ZWJ5_9CHLR|nr:hypothetical protein [Tengunoibacter tsumagoiensis]GCE11243.1 hypothetical protein KTT_11020 [Tengunoibacter tsumagoiensis]
MRAIETVKTLMVSLQSGDLELAAKHLSDTFTLSGFAPRPLNRGEALALQSELLRAMPDFAYNIREIRADGEGVGAFVGITGTHTGELSLPMFGLPTIRATDIVVTLPQTSVSYRVHDEQVVEMVVDAIAGGGISGLLQQIGSELPRIGHEP